MRCEEGSTDNDYERGDFFLLTSNEQVGRTHNMSFSRYTGIMKGRRHSIILLVSLALVAAACGESEQTGGTAAAEGYRIAVIPKSVGFDFWATVKAGADSAAAERGNVEVIWKGMNDETDIAGQIALVESFITQQVDAIVIAAADSRGLVPVLRRAVQTGIPVITIDSNTDPQVSASFIATDNLAAAAAAADLIAEALGGEGKVALIPYIPGASTSNDREQGFKDGLTQYPGLELVATQYSNSDYGRAMTVAEDILTAHPDLNAIFAANEPTVLGVAQALKSRGLAGQITLVGFDASSREIEGVRDGSIRGLIVQNPFMMGYEGVMQAVKVVEGEAVEERIDSGSTIVTAENLEAFLAGR